MDVEGEVVADRFYSTEGVTTSLNQNDTYGITIPRSAYVIITARGESGNSGYVGAALIQVNGVGGVVVASTLHSQGVTFEAGGTDTLNLKSNNAGGAQTYRYGITRIGG